MTFREALAEQRWDDHRYYHHSRINQSLHLVSALSFICAYALLFVAPGRRGADRLAARDAVAAARPLLLRAEGLRRGQPGDPRVQGSRSRSATTCGARWCCMSIWVAVAAAARCPIRRCSGCSTRPATGGVSSTTSRSIWLVVGVGAVAASNASSCSSCATCRPGWCGARRSSPTRSTT